jgi:hypothetical protein
MAVEWLVYAMFAKMAENFDVFDFELNRDEMNKIATLNIKESQFFDHRDPAIVKMLSTCQTEHLRGDPCHATPFAAQVRQWPQRQNSINVLNRITRIRRSKMSAFYLV